MTVRERRRKRQREGGKVDGFVLVSKERTSEGGVKAYRCANIWESQGKKQGPVRMAL